MPQALKKSVCSCCAWWSRDTMILQHSTLCFRGLTFARKWNVTYINEIHDSPTGLQVIVHTFVYSGLSKLSIESINNPQAPTCFKEDSLVGVITVTGYSTFWSTHLHIELLEATKSKNPRLSLSLELYDSESQLK